MYFRIPSDHRPWIAALDRSGRGLIHTSTRRLLGRKMFLWGMNVGGRRWQGFLAAPGEHYLEIQGGLATTQTEYVRMPAGACWEWLEAYGPFSGDAQLVHGDWPAAIEHVEKTLEHELSRSGLEERLNRWQSDADRAPAEILQTGSGWGALENRRRTNASGSPIASSATPFAGLDALRRTRAVVAIVGRWGAFLIENLNNCPALT